MPKISVIIPVYNVEKYLRQCLDSVVNQTLQDIEIICLNDGSPDNSGAILDEYSQRDSRIKVIHKENEGVAITRNKGIDMATGEFVCFMDPDDLYPTKDILEVLYNKAKENDVLIAGGEFSDFTDDNYNLNQNFDNTLDGYIFQEDGIIEYKDYQFDYGHTRFIYNREFLIDNDIFYPNYKRFEDPVFFVKAMFKAKKFYALHKRTYAYRCGYKPMSISSKTIKDCLQGIYDNLCFAKENNLQKLEKYSSERFLEHYVLYKPYLDKEDKNFIRKFYRFRTIRKALLKKKIKTFIQNIFSLKNSENKSHKVITILGFKFKIKKYIRKLSVIIPTMQKNTKILQRLLDNLQFDNVVDEIIIIDNSSKGFTQEFLSKYPKAKLIINSKNEFVNPSWNKGIKIAKNDYWALLNDDIIPPPNFCSGVLEKLNPKIGIVGIDVNSVKDLCAEEVDNIYYSEKKLIIEPALERNYCFGIAMFGHKKSYYKIPNKIKIWFGDDYLFIKNQNAKKQNYVVKNIDIYHCHSLTSDMKCFDEIKKQDEERFFYAFYSPFEIIFSIRNYPDKRHKVITVFGLKLKIKRKKFKQAQRNYYEFLENKNSIQNNSFVDISQQKYNGKNTIKPIAFYLPQFHAIDLNDQNFGKGFTEWTNVTKAIPQFIGHHQPQIPIDVGFYDLSTDKVMYRQIELAKQYGIYGFCFHYYWFSGKRLLEKPIFNYLNNKELDFPFCLCWANENWSKLWDGGNREIIMEQKLLDNDDEKFFYDILPFLKDERYIKIDNKPVLIIYRLNLFEENRVKTFIKNIRNLSKKEGFDDIYLLGVNIFNCENPLIYGVDAVVEFPPHKISEIVPKANLKYLNNNYVGTVFDMVPYVREKSYICKKDSKLYKTVFPGWDNTARKAQSNAFTFICEPDVYKEWLKNILAWTKENHSENEQFVFINAWNEWAEGAHLEPDSKHGYAYLQATKEALEENN